MRRSVVALLVCIALLLFGCADDRHAGGTTVETTNGISGRVVQGGKGVAHVRVLLLPSDLVPIHDPTLDTSVRIALSDEDGGFLFDRVPKGYYNLMARQDSASMAAMVQQLEAGDSAIVLLLGSTGALQVSLRGLPLRPGDVLSLAGTDLFAMIDSTTLSQGTALVDEAPAGTYGPWILTQASADSLVHLELAVDSLEVRGGDTTFVSGDSLWPSQLGLRVYVPTLPTTVDSFPLQIRFDSLRLDPNIADSGLCILDESGAMLPYTVVFIDSLAEAVWVQASRLGPAADTLSWTLLWNTGRACPEDSAAVFGSNVLAAVHLGNQHLDSTTTGPSLAGIFGSPTAVTLTALVQPDTGLLGGEMISLANAVGMRMDRLDSMVTVYAYSSYSGASEWHVISGFMPYYPPLAYHGWITVALVVDPSSHRFELYINGEEASAYEATDTLHPIAYDKGGTTLTVGHHAYRTDGKFIGSIGEAALYGSAKSVAWIRLDAKNLLGGLVKKDSLP